MKLNDYICVNKIDMTTAVANKIRNLRKAKGYSQEEVAERLSISQSAYARIERGESHSWAAHLEKLSEIFEVKPEDLLSDDINNFNSLDQLGGFAFQNVGTINTINSLSEKLIEQYEVRIAELKEEVTSLKEEIKLLKSL